MSARRLIGPWWQLLRVRRPAAAARIEEAALAARGRDALVADVRVLRSRLAELERDHLLLAAHVASLTAATEPAAAGAEEAVQRARLAAVAGYEQRIGALEARLAGRPARRRRGRVAGAGTSGERRDRAR